MLRLLPIFLCLMLNATSAQAHHAFAADYQADKIGTIEGEVKEVFYKNPHARYYVEVTKEDGSIEEWDVQTMNLGMLARLGWKKDTIEIGDKVVIMGNLGRNDKKRINILTLEEEDGKIWRPMGNRPDIDRAVEAAGGKPASLAAAIASGEYELDENHAYIEFSYSHLGLSNPKLRFNEFDAVLNLNGEDMTISSVSINIDAASIDSAIAQFNDELKGEDFFDVANHPTITFASTSYEETSPATGTLSGELTIKGITRPVTLDVRINAANENVMSRKHMIGFSAAGVLNRSDFGLDAGLPMVGDEVSLRIQTEFEKVN